MSYISSQIRPTILESKSLKDHVQCQLVDLAHFQHIPTVYIYIFVIYKYAYATMDVITVSVPKSYSGMLNLFKMSTVIGIGTFVLIPASDLIRLN